MVEHGVVVPDELDALAASVDVEPFDGVGDLNMLAASIEDRADRVV